MRRTSRENRPRIHVGQAVLFALLGSCGSSSGQGTTTAAVVWPPSFANAPGNAAMATPFTIARSTVLDTTRVMHSMSASTLPLIPGQVITEVSWRRDATESQSYSAVRGEIRIRMGVVPDAMKLSGTFQRAWTASAIEVVRRTSYDVPAAPATQGGQTAPFVPPIAFDVPFPYQGGDLAIEIEFTGPRGAIWRRDAVLIPSDVSGSRHDYGVGCAASNGFVPRLSTDLGRALPGGSIDARIDLAPWPRAGVDLATLEIGVPVAPIPLEPAGFPAGCSKHVGAVQMEVAALADRSSRFASAAFSIPLPEDSKLIGMRLALQGLVADSGSTATVPMVTTDAFELEIGSAAEHGPRYGRTVWRYGSPDGSAASGGFVSPDNYVPVLQFTVQQ